MHTNGYDAIIFVDDDSKVYMFDEILFPEIEKKLHELTTAELQQIDFSAADGCETAEDINNDIGCNNDIYNFNELEYEYLIQF